MENIVTLYIAIKRASFDRESFTIAGSEFSPNDAKKLIKELQKLMGDSCALEALKEANQ